MKERIKDVDERRAEGKQLGVIWPAWSCWRVSVLSHPGLGQYMYMPTATSLYTFLYIIPTYHLQYLFM